MDLIDRLAAHKTLGGAPREELTWLATHGELRALPVGHVVARRTQPTVEMLVVLVGYIVQYVERVGSTGAGTGRRKLMDWHAGDVTGLLPYSRMTSPPGDSVVEEPTEVLAIRREHFPALERECPTVTSMLVHVMLDRGHHFASNHFQDEKMMSLGRLAAGLAHELNNPASAAARSAKMLSDVLSDAEQASRALTAAHVTDEHRAALDLFRDHCFAAPLSLALSPIERADREDEITSWCESRGLDASPASTLADAGVTVDALDTLAGALPANTLAAALRSAAASCASRALVFELERGASRIHDLVSAVKRFSYMDRAAVPESMRIGEGLIDTIAVLAAKARAKSVAITLDVLPDLPTVRGFGGELNQVWSNVIDNALDAAPVAGHVGVSAIREGDEVAVRVIDDGAGIPAEMQRRIFDPFFTTKPVGAGTGLGLDIAMRIVRSHGGDIEVTSRPGRTEFRIAIPAEQHAT